MLKFMLAGLGLVLTLNAQAADNTACNTKAMAIAKAVYAVDFGNAAQFSIEPTVNNETTYAYVVAANTGQKFSINYAVSMSVSGEACYLQSLTMKY